LFNAEMAYSLIKWGANGFPKNKGNKMPRFHDEDMPEGICDSCGEGCTATVIDEGIGPYEYWGSKGVHHAYATVSPCCNAEVVEGEEKIVSRNRRIARKDHKDGKVKKGNLYCEVVFRAYRKGGPSWHRTTKRVIAETPLAF
jgi:hypothetical protein